VPNFVPTTKPGFVFSRSESKPRRWWTRKLRERGQPETRAFFGATVRYANAAGAERVVSIVGTDEVDLNRNHISWVSPLGRALMKSAAGDSVVLQAPGGTEYLTVLEVCYERISVEPFREPPGSEASAKGLPRRR
jgi:transcription elongation factor GreB